MSLRTASLAVRGIADRVDVQVGRFGYSSGAERASGTPKIESVKRMRINSWLVGEFEWSLYQRSFDGARADWRMPSWTLTGLAARPTQGGFEDAAGLGIGDILIGSVVRVERWARHLREWQSVPAVTYQGQMLAPGQANKRTSSLASVWESSRPGAACDR